MAAFSPDSDPEDVLPALARNVVTNGYQASRSNDELEETEYLKLVHRYLAQARELGQLAGADKFIKVPTCESTQTNDLLRILGFRMRGGCGSEVVLETVNAPRAFLTTDSGFPLAQLEQALRTDKPFTYDFHPTPVPVLYTAGLLDHGAKRKRRAISSTPFSAIPGSAGFYLGMSKLDPETADALKKECTPRQTARVCERARFLRRQLRDPQGKAVLPGRREIRRRVGRTCGSFAG